MVSGFNLAFNIITQLNDPTTTNDLIYQNNKYFITQYQQQI